LRAACTLAGSIFFNDLQAFTDRFSSICESSGLDALTLQCHMPNMNKIKTVCVYCGSGPGTNPRFVEAAIGLGKILAENGIGLVYGGGSTGMMGALAASVLDHGGSVTAIIPDFLVAREIALPRVQELIITGDMHERKRLMFERSDAFVALPGGIGTLEELVEQMTWQQLGRHSKPIAILNVDFFWDPLLKLFDHMGFLGFIHSRIFIRYTVAEEVGDLLPKLIEAVRTAAQDEAQMIPDVVRRF
jgi:uncharacterized protein (TIGR00730 family)